MKALYALPLVMLSLVASAAPAAAEDLRFEDAESQLLEVIEQFGFDQVELYESTENCVRYRCVDDEFIFFVVYFRDNQFACYATWDNELGERRDTLQHANEWNSTSWSSRLILIEDGSWKLFTPAPRELAISTDGAVDLLDAFLSDVDAFIATF